MAKAHSESNKRIWATKGKEERTKIMSARAKERMAKLTPQERSAIAKKMVMAREKKRALNAV